MNERPVLLYDSSIHPWHADLEVIQAGLVRLRVMGAECRELDTKEMPEQELDSWRAKAVDAAIRGHQGIRQIFGSRQKGGLPYFGRQVPALLVFEEDQVIPTEVYPHRKSGGQDFSIESWIQDRLGRK